MRVAVSATDLPGATAFEQALLELDREAARSAFAVAVGSVWDTTAVDHLVVPALERIGEAWERGTVSLAQVYMGARIAEELVERLLPPPAPMRREQPRVGIGVLDDTHGLGKRIVLSMLCAAGYEVIDYGTGLNAPTLASRVEADALDVVLVSTLMLRSALQVSELMARLRAVGRPVKVVVGGAPFRFDDTLWSRVGADAMARSAAEVIGLVARLAGAS